MPPAALALLLVAAALHAGWNLLVKRAQQKQVFTCWALVVGSICFLPLLIIGLPLPVQVWPYAIASALLEAAYYIALTYAYDIDDFSLIYPVARGTAPALLAVWAAIFLGERPRPLGFVGLALLVLGLIVVGGAAWWSQRKLARPSMKGVLVALAAACFISFYTVIDGAAVHVVSSTPYTVLVIGLSTVFVAPAVLLRYGYCTVMTEWRTNWLRIIIVGVLMLLAYILVLRTYTFAQVNYAGAVREISIVFAAFVGWRWLGEDFGRVRLLGAVLIFVGILAIALVG